VTTIGTRAEQQMYIERNCRWRASRSAVSGAGGGGASTVDCMSTAPGTACEWRDLIMLPWCAMANQSMV
jgi:hypothetical protein